MSPSSPSRSTAVKRRKHTKEFKTEAVRLARQAEIGFSRAAKDLGIHESLLRAWAASQAKDGADALEEENARLQREVRTLTMEREILKKAAAFFARENP